MQPTTGDVGHRSDMIQRRRRRARQQRPVPIFEMAARDHLDIGAQIARGVRIARNGLHYQIEVASRMIVAVVRNAFDQRMQTRR